MTGLKLTIKCFLVYALLPVAGYKFGLSAKHLWQDPSEYLYFGLSIPLCYYLMVHFGGSRLRFMQTFTHELIHSIFSLLSLKRVYEFHVNEETGHIITDCKHMTMQLAPYFFPLYTIILMAIRPGIVPAYYPLFDIVAGYTFAFYLNMIIRDTGIWQTDIKIIDWRLSYPYTVLMVFLCSYLVIESIHTNLWSAILQLFTFAGDLIISRF